MLQKKYIISFMRIKMKYMPNILTVLRLLACPLLIYLYEGDDLSGALIIFFLACLTDFFDGYLARKGNFKSNFGKLLDPIADKALIITMCIIGVLSGILIKLIQILLILPAMIDIFYWVILGYTLSIISGKIAKGKRSARLVQKEKFRIDVFLFCFNRYPHVQMKSIM